MEARTAVSGCKAVVTGSASDRACRTASPSTTVRRQSAAPLSHRRLSLPSRPSTTTTIRRLPHAELATRAAADSFSSPGPTRRDSRRLPGLWGLGWGSAAPWQGRSSCGSRWAPVRRRRHGQVGALEETVQGVDRPVKTASRLTRTAARASLVRYATLPVLSNCCTVLEIFL